MNDAPGPRGNEPAGRALPSSRRRNARDLGRGSLVLLALVVCGHAGAKSYTLPDLVSRVSLQSPTLVAEQATMALRRAQKLEQEMRWLPDGDATFFVSSAPEVRCLDNNGQIPKGAAIAAALNDCLRTNVVDRATSAPGTSAADRAPVHGVLLNFNVSLRQPLFTSLKIESAIRAARAGLASERAVLNGVGLDVAMTAVQLYAQLKTARAMLGAYDRAIVSLSRFLAFIESELDGKNRSGFVEGDALRLRAQLETLKIARLDSQRTFHASTAALRAVTDDPEAMLDDDDLEPTSLPGDEVAAWHERMERDRPELNAGRAGIQYLRQVVRVQRGFALPDLVLVTAASGGYAPTFDTPTLGFANLPASAPGAVIGLAVHQPLSIGPAIARTSQAQHDQRMQQLRLELGQKAWNLEVDKAWLDLDEASRRREELEHGLRVVEGWYAAVDQEVALGLRTDGRELVEVVLNWIGFETRTLQARADLVVATATLHRASGQPVIP